MTFTHKMLLSSTAIAGTLLMAATPSFAQVTPTPQGEPGAAVTTAPPGNAELPRSSDASGAPTDEATDVSEIVVTGSRLRRDPTNAPAPLIQLGREEIIQSGEPNVVDFLADIPALQNSTVPEDTTGSNLNDGGLSFLDLRNLGTLRTLVLIDGRRHVGSAQGDLRVDVDSIPSLLVESVEVVTGGQSAVYGADAVSGVVNFILRKDFEGLEIDGALAEINQDGQINGRISGLVGHNFLDGRLNVYAFGEYQKSEEVQDLDIDWRRNGVATFTNDVDPAPGQPDGTIDVQLVNNVRTLGRVRGGLLTLPNQPFASPASDRDTPIQNCGAAPAAFNPATASANCTAIRPDNPSKFFVFNADGTSRPVNFGTAQPGSGFSRGTNVGGDGLFLNTEQAQGSRLPESEAVRFQTGFNFAVSDSISLFGEAKYVKEETYDAGQPTFFGLQFVNLQPNQTPTLFSIQNFNVGLDNAFLPANVRAAILANTRPLIDAQGQPTGATVADQRGLLTVFGPSRTQFNERELQRYVVGLRGDREQLGPVSNFSWEAGYTWGKVESTNNEAAVDIGRVQLAADAIRNAAGQIVCRSQDLIARGIAVPNQDLGGNYAANDPSITGCVPINFFGTDFRNDANAENISGGGNRPGLTAAQAQYILASINVDDMNEQQDFLATASGEVLEGFLPAGPIGIAIGYEYRDEKTSSSGRDRDTGDRTTLFLNSSPAFPEVGYDVNEYFGEVRVPLLSDLPFAENLEVSGAYRLSDYSTLGEVETYSLQSQWRPFQDLSFRATYGEATRIPTLSDLYDPGGQTFGNGLTDPCDSVALQSSAVPAAIQANRRANCVALLGAGYNPDSTRIVYSSGVPGTSQGNVNLQPETSRSYTIGAVIQPRWIPNLSLVADYYDIKIQDVIVSVLAQDLLNNCVSGASPNQSACSLLFRNGATAPTGQVPFGLLQGNSDIGFIEGPLNYAALEAKGIDFNASYLFDFEEMTGRNWGQLNYSLRGNYLIRQQDFINAADPGLARDNDSYPSNPRVRFLSTLTYSPREWLSVTWDWDWQSSQELRDSDLFLTDPDSRDPFLIETGDFHQHDFSVRWDVRPQLTLRAGVVNAFDAEPPLPVQSGLSDGRGLAQTVLQLGDNFDFFGRRFYVGFNMKLGSVASLVPSF